MIWYIRFTWKILTYWLISARSAGNSGGFMRPLLMGEKQPTSHKKKDSVKLGFFRVYPQGMGYIPLKFTNSIGTILPCTAPHGWRTRRVRFVSTHLKHSEAIVWVASGYVNISIESDHRNSGFFHWNMVILNSYVSHYQRINDHISHLKVGGQLLGHLKMMP